MGEGPFFGETVVTPKLWRDALVSSVQVTNERMAYICQFLTAVLAHHRGTTGVIRVGHEGRGGKETMIGVDWRSLSSGRSGSRLQGRARGKPATTEFNRVPCRPNCRVHDTRLRIMVSKTRKNKAG